MEMHAFHSLALASTPKRLYLKLPDGTVSEAWVECVFRDAPQFAAAKRQYQQFLLENAEKAKPDENLSVSKTPWLLAHSITAWSFDTELTIENAERFLVECPQVLEDVDDFVYNRSRFFAKA